MGSDTSNSSLVFLQYLTSVFDNIEDGILLLSVEPKHTYRLVTVNKAFYRNTGYKTDIIGSTVDTMVDADDYRHLAERYQQVITSKEPLQYRRRYTVPNGPTIFSVQLIPVLNAVGEVIQIASISRDVTELEMLRQAARETADLATDIARRLRAAGKGGRET